LSQHLKMTRRRNTQLLHPATKTRLPNFVAGERFGFGAALPTLTTSFLGMASSFCVPGLVQEDNGPLALHVWVLDPEIQGSLGRGPPGARAGRRGGGLFGCHGALEGQEDDLAHARAIGMARREVLGDQARVRVAAPACRHQILRGSAVPV